MTGRRPNKCRPGAASHARPQNQNAVQAIAGYVALGLLGLCLGASVWMALQPAKADPVLSYGMIALGTGGGLTALVAYLRDMTFGAVAKAGLECLVGIGDLLSTIVSLLCW